jgi:hypothetical protein
MRRVPLLSVALVGTDIVLICCDILLRTGSIGDPRWSLGREDGFAEVWQHAKAAATAAVLLGMAIRPPSLVKLVWAFLFVYLLADDAGQWHEQAGIYLGRELALPALGGLRPNHVGEVLFLGGVGLVWGAGLLVALVRARHDDVSFSRRLLAWLCALAAFGVLLDAVHSLLRRTALNDVFAVLEDGGEMVVLSLILVHLFPARPRAAPGA